MSHDVPVVHTGLELLENVLVELVDLTNVEKHQLHVRMWNHLFIPCVEIIDCLVEGHGNQL